MDEGALFHVVRAFRLYRALDYASFGHYTRDRFGMAGRTAEQHADTHRAFWIEPVLSRAWLNDQISDSHLGLFRRLIRTGIRGQALAPWVERAREVPVITFRDQVRWIESVREGWSAGPSAGPSAPPCPSAPPSRQTWSRIRSELNLCPDLFLWLAHGSAIDGVDGREPSADFRAQPPGRAHPPRPDLTHRADAPGTPEPSSADFRAPARRLDLTRPADNPLIPSPEEPETGFCRLFGPPDLIESYLDAIEATRAIFSPDRPAWWCLEVMILHVRRGWAAENAHARRNTKHYSIYERDGFRCTAPGCTSRRDLHAHHLDFASHGGSDDPSNLTTLCRACHLRALHREARFRVHGTAPDNITWEMAFEDGPDGTRRPRRTYLGEFRISDAKEPAPGEQDDPGDEFLN